MEPLPWYEKSDRRGLIVILGLILTVFITAYIANTENVNITELIAIFIIIAMIIVLAVSLYRWMKGQSIYWWTGHPDTSWEGARNGEERGEM